MHKIILNQKFKRKVLIDERSRGKNDCYMNAINMNIC